MSSSFYFPTKIVVSEEAAVDLVLELKGVSPDGVFVITDQGIIQHGIADAILSALYAAGLIPPFMTRCRETRIFRMLSSHWML